MPLPESSNELPVARELLEGLMQPGERHYRVEVGPSPDAKVVDVRFDGRTLVLVYDRPIVEPRLTALYP